MNALDKFLGFLSPTFKSTIPVDLGTVETELSDEQKKLIGQEEKKPGIESIRVNIAEDPEKKTGIASLNINDRKKMLESVMLDEAGQNLIETVDMFKPYTKPFESKELGKIYTSNVINNVLPYLPEGIDKNKFKGLLMHGADKESTYGHDAQTYKFRKTKQGRIVTGKHIINNIRSIYFS